MHFSSDEIYLRTFKIDLYITLHSIVMYSVFFGVCVDTNMAIKFVLCEITTFLVWHAMSY